MSLKRILAKYEDSDYQIQIFSLTNGEPDFEDICAIIVGEVTETWGSQTEGAGILMAEPYKLTMNIKITNEDLNIWTMILTKDGNYDGLYLGNSDYPLVYAMVYDKIEAEYRYSVISDDSYTLNHKNHDNGISLVFTDGLERTKDEQQYQTDGINQTAIWGKYGYWSYSSAGVTVSAISGSTVTVSGLGSIVVGSRIRLTTGSSGRQYEVQSIAGLVLTLNTTAVGSVSDTVYLGTAPTGHFLMQSLFETAVQTYSKNNGLKTFSCSIVTTDYPFSFENLASTVSRDVDALYTTERALNEGLDDNSAYFKTSNELITSIVNDLSLLLCSKGIGEFVMKPRYWKNGTTIYKDDFDETPIRSTINSGKIASVIGHFSYRSYERWVTAADTLLGGSQVLTVEPKTGKSVSRDIKFGAIGTNGNLLVFNSPTYYDAYTVASATAGNITYWANIFYEMFHVFYNSYVSTYYAPAGLTFTMSKPTRKGLLIEYGDPYEMEFMGINFKLFPKTITRHLKSKMDEIEFISVKEMTL